MCSVRRNRKAEPREETSPEADEANAKATMTGDSRRSREAQDSPESSNSKSTASVEAFNKT